MRVCWLQRSVTLDLDVSQGFHNFFIWRIDSGILKASAITSLCPAGITAFQAEQIIMGVGSPS